MNQTGPIIVIEDDIDDQDIMGDVFKKLAYPNDVIFFSNGIDALDYLNKTEIQPFLILSDINMPRMNGFEIKDRIASNAQLHLKCIPYLFFTTGVSREAVIEAYSLYAQGFFVKPHTISDMENIIRKIVEYWKECFAPNHFH